MWTLTNQAKGVRLRAAPRLMMLAKVGSWCSLGPLTIVLGAKAIHLITIVSYTSVCSSVKWVSDTLLQNQLPLNSNESQVKSSLHRRFGHHKVRSRGWAHGHVGRASEVKGLVLGPPQPRGPRLALSGESPILRALAILSPEQSPKCKQGFPTLGPPRMTRPLQAVLALHQALGCWPGCSDTSLTPAALELQGHGC